jgi:hypothetical protein
MYPSTKVPKRRIVERVQTGVRIERRILLVLKALAASYDLSLGDLFEGIVLHVFEGRLPLDARSRKRVLDLRRVYGLDLRASDSHLLVERSRKKAKKR